jgi:lipopolysaccharide export system protein LptC
LNADHTLPLVKDMTWNSNKTIIAIVLLLLLGLSLWLPNALVKPVIALNSTPQHEPDYHAENFISTMMSAQGNPKYVLRGRKITHYPDDDTSLLEHPQLTQYTPGSATTHTSADRGKIYNHGKDLLMLGNVRVTRGKDQAGPGGEISTQELHVVLN